jgi:hypothetical protein
MRRVIVVIAVLGALGSGCSGGDGSEAAFVTARLPAAGNSIASLKATAVAWAHAFLVGSLEDIKALQGPECDVHDGTPVPIRTARQYLDRERVAMRRYFGRALDTIEIQRVAVRNVTPTTGEALLEYNLPPTVVGNDNWVTYAVHNGRWKVSDCRAPIGGSSSSASAGGTASVP